MIKHDFFYTHRNAFWLLVGLVLINLLAWGWALTLFRHSAPLIAAALLAYGYGLRHAVDADHIAAIDNVTRKLMQQGQRPVAVGAFSPSDIPVLWFWPAWPLPQPRWFSATKSAGYMIMAAPLVRWFLHYFYS